MTLALNGVRFAENLIEKEAIEERIPKSKIEDLLAIVDHYKSVEKQVREDVYEIAKRDVAIRELQDEISELNAEKKRLQEEIASLQGSIEEQKKNLKKASEEIDERKIINDAFAALKRNDEQGLLMDIAQDLKVTYKQLKRSENKEMDVELGEIYREMLKKVFKLLDKKGIRME